MEPTSPNKRRKLNNHPANGATSEHSLIDFESPSAARVSSSSTFALQASELLREIRLPPDSPELRGVVAQLHDLRAAIEDVEPHDPVPLDEASQNLKKQYGIEIPFPHPRPSLDSPYKVSYATPKCNVVGSYALESMARARGELGIDLVVEMPRSMFQEKDYLDMRYFYRRAYFLAYVTAGLRKRLGDGAGLSFCYLNDNPLLPILEVRLDPASAYIVRIVPFAPPDLFRKQKLLPSCCCNRAPDISDSKRQTPTPFYNSTIKAEETFVTYMRVLAAARSKCSAFSDACLLGRAWLRQRGLCGSVSRGGFGHFEWALVTALLLEAGGGRKDRPPLSPSLSATELFRAVVHFLSKTPFAKKPFVFGSVQPKSHGAAKESGPVMSDPATDLNILFKMSPWSAGLLQRFARATSELLGNPHADQFGPTFIVNASPPIYIFDMMVTVEIAARSSGPSLSHPWGQGSDIHRVLAKAFGNRAQLVHVRCVGSGATSWDLGSPAPDTSCTSFEIGIIYDPQHMGRQMVHGPPAEEQKEAEAFRKFWGEKAELRRFRNGSILECVEWTVKGDSAVCREIACYVLGRHLKIGYEHISFPSLDISKVLPIAPSDKRAFDAAREALQGFESDIRGAEGMILQIRTVSPAHTFLRYSSVEVPSLSLHEGVQLVPMDVFLTFEASSKWPDNLVAIQHAKIEFLLDIGKRLGQAGRGIAAHLGRENVDIVTSVLPNLAYLDVVYPTGAVFRLRILCDLEETLLERLSSNKALDGPVRAEAEDLLHDFRWASSLLPLHCQMISACCTRMPALSPTIRLVKHWFAGHMLSGHFSEELVELFVLHAFLHPYPWTAPSSPAAGFMRTLLFLSCWDWRDEPLVIDPAGGQEVSSISASERSTLLHSLQSWRQRDPNLARVVMFVATSHDRSGLAYTRRRPSKMLAARMTRLASAAIRAARESGTSGDLSKLFRTPLRDYDVLIHLSPRAVKEAVRGLSSKVGARHSHFKNLDDRTGRVPLPLARHPSEMLLGELERVYGDSLLFFRGGTDQHVIAALWHPKVLPQNFRVGLPYNIRAIKDDGTEQAGNGGRERVELNKTAVLLEIARLGGDLIKKIEEVKAM